MQLARIIYLFGGKPVLIDQPEAMGTQYFNYHLHTVGDGSSIASIHQEE
jgi:hypothetical protein